VNDLAKIEQIFEFVKIIRILNINSTVYFTNQPLSDEFRRSEPPLQVGPDVSQRRVRVRYSGGEKALYHGIGTVGRIGQDDMNTIQGVSLTLMNPPLQISLPRDKILSVSVELIRTTTQQFLFEQMACVGIETIRRWR